MPDWTAQQIEFPKIAWQGTPPPQEEWPSYFEGLQQQGYNIMGGLSAPVTDLDWWRDISQAAEQSQIGLMPWAGKGMAGEADWGPASDPYGERLRPEWETWISALAEQPSFYGMYAWEEPNVFRQLYGEPTPESMLQQYEAMKRLAPEGKVVGSLGLAEPQYAQNYPDVMDVMLPEFYMSAGPESEAEWRNYYERLYDPIISQFQGDVYPLYDPSKFGDIGIEDITSVWESLAGPLTGLGYYGTANQELITAYNALLGGGAVPPVIPPTEPVQPTEPSVPYPYPGGEQPMATPNLWTDPYGFDILTPTATTYPPWVPRYEGETFPWARSMYPEAIGPGPESGEHYIPSFPHYRQYPYTPPSPTGFQYGAYPTPESFYSPITTPGLEAYQAGGAGAYPETQGFAGPTQPEAIDYIGQMLRGEIEIPGEAEIWQEFLGRTGTAERLAQEELTKTAERGGRAESGLYPMEQERIRTGTQRGREEFAGELATTKAQMRVDAQQAAIPLSMAQTQYGAGEADRVQQARERLWGAETTDLFNEFTSKLEVATTDYDMRAAQNELLESGRERVFEASREEYRKAFEEAKASGLRDDEAEELAWERGLTEWQQLYQSIVMAATQEYDWVRQRREWSEQRGQVVLGAHQAAPGAGDYLGMALASFLGGIGQGIGGG